MEFKIKQNITPEDLLQGISWHGETDGRSCNQSK